MAPDAEAMVREVLARCDLAEHKLAEAALWWPRQLHRIRMENRMLRGEIEGLRKHVAWANSELAKALSGGR